MECLPLEANKEQLFIGKVKNKSAIELFNKEKFIKSLLEKGDELCAYQRPPLQENSDNFFLVEVKIF